MRKRQRQRRQQTSQASPLDALSIVFAMHRAGVGFAFSNGGTLKLSNTSVCPAGLWSAFIGGDQFQLCAAVRQLLSGAPDPMAWPDEQPQEVAA